MILYSLKFHLKVYSSKQPFYNKIKFMFVYGVEGAELDEYIDRSKIILNIHAFGPYARQEQPRIFYLLIN